MPMPLIRVTTSIVARMMIESLCDNAHVVQVSNPEQSSSYLFKHEMLIKRRQDLGQYSLACIEIATSTESWYYHAKL